MPQIYVIYRPEDTRKKSAEIIQALQKTYGASSIQYPNFDGYVDVYQIERDVQKTNYLLVIIGNYWGDLVDEGGQNLLASVYDPVHMAIATAITSRKRIVPILIDGATMPPPKRLPRELRPLTTQEPVKLEKNVAISKSLNKGLKDVIKRDSSFMRIPEFITQKKAQKAVTPRRAPSQPRLRQPAQQQDWRTWVSRARLPLVIMACLIAVIITLMMITPTFSRRYSTESQIVTPVLATIAPVSTATTMTSNESTITESPPQIVTPTRQRITVDNAHLLELMDGHVVSIASTNQFIFSADESLFIFGSPEIQEVQVIDVETNLVITMLDTSPYEPLVIELSDDETLLHVLMSNGKVSSWGIPSDS